MDGVLPSTERREKKGLVNGQVLLINGIVELTFARNDQARKYWLIQFHGKRRLHVECMKCNKQLNV